LTKGKKGRERVFLLAHKKFLREIPVHWEARVVEWQTRTFEGRMPQGVGVQVPPRALLFLPKYSILQHTPASMAAVTSGNSHKKHLSEADIRTNFVTLTNVSSNWFLINQVSTLVAKLTAA